MAPLRYCSYLLKTIQRGCFMREVSDTRRSVGNLEEFVDRLRQKGVLLWTEGAALRYRAPRGVLTAEDRHALSCANDKIALHLERRSRPMRSAPTVSSRAGVRRAPLSFTQLEHWHDRLRHGGRPIRHIASEFRLKGNFQVDVLKESIATVGRRHDALRTRIVISDDLYPVQEVADEYRVELEVIQLQTGPEAQRAEEVEQLIKSTIVDADNYAMSPLFRAVLIVISTQEYVLILALDHMVSDLASLEVLSTEVFTAYAQLSNGGPIELPRIQVQFPDHAADLRARSKEVLGSVQRRCAPVGRVRFPRDSHGGQAGCRTACGSARFAIDKDFAEELRAWARRHRTTIVMATLTAYAALILRWCSVNEVVIRFMTDGRTHADLEYTIGYLAFAVYLRVQLEERTTFRDLLEIVTEEYCRARDEADFGYAMSQEVRPEFTFNTGINWLPDRAGVGNAVVPGGEVVLARTAVEFSELVLPWIGECDQDSEPGVAFREKDGVVTGHIGYALDRFSDSSMARFASNFIEFLAVMMRSPTRRIMDVELK